MNLANNLKKIRKEHNLSQEQLAEQLGVSRQSVSKWESGAAYPEMDKVLQICQLFKVNIDDLMNQDIKEVNNIKQSKNNINKFIDDFLDYITKTIDFFSSMKFKGKIKCLFEQGILAFIIGTVLLILVLIVTNIFRNIFYFLPSNIYYIIYNMVEGILFIIALILGIALLLYIFKIRYLDYYVIVKEENVNEEKSADDKSSIENKIVLEKKQDKIIIRDPKHSGYKFISGLLKSFLFITKTIVLFITLMFCISLIILSVCLCISFTFVKTGLVFIGVLVSLVSLIIINLIILKIFYDFLVSHKSSKGKLAIIFASTLISLGLGIGLFSVGLTNFDVIHNYDDNYFISSEQTISMRDDLFFEDYYGVVEYIESDNNDVKIVYSNTELYEIYMEEHRTGYTFYLSLNDSNFLSYIRTFIKDINDKKMIDYSNYKVSIYTTKQNIDTLKNNLHEHWQNY